MWSLTIVSIWNLGFQEHRKNGSLVSLQGFESFPVVGPGSDYSVCMPSWFLNFLGFKGKF